MTKDQIQLLLVYVDAAIKADKAYTMASMGKYMSIMEAVKVDLFNTAEDKA